MGGYLHRLGRANAMLREIALKTRPAVRDVPDALR
jgi:hypothetical protein